MDIERANARVTEGVSGLGRASAEVLAARGAPVTGLAIDQYRCAQVAKGGDGVALAGDARDAAGLAGVTQTARGEPGPSAASGPIFATSSSMASIGVPKMPGATRFAAKSEEVVGVRPSGHDIVANPLVDRAVVRLDRALRLAAR